MTLLPPAELHWRTAYHDHCEVCWQCRCQPFGSCEVGVAILLEFPVLSSAEETQTTTNEKELNAIT